MSCTGCKYLARDFFAMDQEALLNFLYSHNVLLKEKQCPRCGAMCKLRDRHDTVLFYKCTASVLVAKPKKKKRRVPCNFQESIRKNTFFEGTVFTIKDICDFVVFEGMRLIDATNYIAEQTGWSRKSVIDFKNFVREVYVDWSMSHIRPTIGGPGKIVEIDETKIGKRKYNCGRIVEGQWVFGGIERGSKSFFIVPVENRNTETLLEVIKNRIADGSTIISDCWKSYNCLDDEGYQHQTVNHSKNFVDPVTGAHTQNVERLWLDLKGNIPRYGRTKKHCFGYLARFQFHKEYKTHGERIHEIFMAIGRLYDPTRVATINLDTQFETDSETEEDAEEEAKD